MWPQCLVTGLGSGNATLSAPTTLQGRHAPDDARLCAAVSLAVRRVPAKLRSIELQRLSNYNGGSEAALLSAVMDQVLPHRLPNLALMTMRPTGCP